MLPLFHGTGIFFVVFDFFHKVKKKTLYGNDLHRFIHDPALATKQFTELHEVWLSQFLTKSC